MITNRLSPFSAECIRIGTTTQYVCTKSSKSNHGQWIKFADIVYLLTDLGFFVTSLVVVIDLVKAGPYVFITHKERVTRV